MELDRRLVFLLVTLLGLATTLGQGNYNNQGGRYNPQAGNSEDKIPTAQLENWALSFGTVLWETARAATRFDAIQKKFHTNGAKVAAVDGYSMVRDMAKNVETMMQHKIDAIKRIMEVAEELALGHQFDKDLGHALKQSPMKGNGFHYINAKKINVLAEGDESGGDDFDKYLSAEDRAEDDDRFQIGFTRLKLEANKYFSGIPVNTNHSAVHVPTNVFDGDPNVVNGIKWSMRLDNVFEDNYNRDPSLSWQYFGSTYGFMRQYPAMKWLTSDYEPDLYDARMREWYIKAAASPKELVILLDTSGSMTGLRQEIAKHVVLNILETLGEDDFVAIYRFSKYPTPLVDCFSTEDGRAELVQATNENIREYQDALNNIVTEDIANFTSSLNVAFEVLKESSKDSTIGTNCNQAIMLVTDGVPYRYEDIFKNHNLPHKPVRMFTYLIGREISDLKAANWMACHNRGYFSHVTTLAEVKEQVLKYLPVMARPMVMFRDKHPIQWTGVYADVEVKSETPLWLVKLEKPIRQSKLIEESQMKKSKFTGYRLMTSVSIPVFDKKNHTEPESLGIKQNPEVAFLRKVRIAQLLGVAGTDVPVREIEKLTPPFELGVNGYSFAINNNGYVLFHPDLRPMFQEILKPNYNSVDLAEVELVFNPHEDMEPRGNDSELLASKKVTGFRDYEMEMRKAMINQINGMNRLTVKQHYDFMHRATVKTMEYFYYKLNHTPFSLGIALPEDFGKFKVDAQIDVSQARYNLSQMLDGDDWKLHPDWVYCEYNYAGDRAKDFTTPEETFKHFLAKMQSRDWNWGTPRVRPLPKCTKPNSYDPNCMKCSKELIQSLLFDAFVTKDFEKAKSPRPGQDDYYSRTSQGSVLGMLFELTSRNETYRRVGITLAFIATRSGLMRYSDHSELFKDPDEDIRGRGAKPSEFIKEPHFSEINNKATEETWYKRAVDYHKVNPNAFVYSIPFDVGERKTTVTATHAIMVGRGTQKAPAAVAGMQIDYEIFREMFFNETRKCVTGTIDCDKTCASEDIECYVVDNNGFVVISEDSVHTGQFFGEVDGTILESLVQHSIYRPIKIYDYQAICLEPEEDDGAATAIYSPLKFFGWLFNTLMSQIAYTIIRFELHHFWNPDWTYAAPSEDIRRQQQQNNRRGRKINSNPTYKAYEADFDDYASDDPYLSPQYADNMPLYDGYPQDGAGMGYPGDDDPFIDEFTIKDGGPIPLLKMTYINKTTPRPCDKEVTLYELNESKLYRNGRPVTVKGKLQNCHESDCERPFNVRKIPHTNLILIVADKLCPCFTKKISIDPIKVDYGPANETAYCERLKYNIYRKKPEYCKTYHPEETEIKLCGDASSSYLALNVVVITAFCLWLANGPNDRN